MDDKLRYRFQQLEIEPPTGTWNAIAAKLEAEGTAGQSLADRINSVEIEPPSIVWQNIVAELDGTSDTMQTTSSEASVIQMHWRRIASVAAVFVVAAVAVFFLFFNNNSSKKATTLTTIPNLVLVNPDLTEKVQQQTGLLATNDRTNNNVSGSVSGNRPRQNNRPRLKNFDVDEYLQPVRSENIQVTAPLITDESGNLIMDTDLVLDNNERYITVTSPNGQKTRLSAKFIAQLDKLYGVSQRAHDEAAWISRFEDWKNRFHGSGFVPASGNYMDILELKELLMEQ